MPRDSLSQYDQLIPGQMPADLRPRDEKEIWRRQEVTCLLHELWENGSEYPERPRLLRALSELGFANERDAERYIHQRRRRR